MFFDLAFIYSVASLSIKGLIRVGHHSPVRFFPPQDKALSRMLDSESSSESDNEEKKKENEEEEKKEEEDAGKKGKKKKETGEGKRSTKSSANNSRSTTPTPSKLDGLLRNKLVAGIIKYSTVSNLINIFRS